LGVYLSKEDKLSIRKWIQELRKYKYKPKTAGDTPAITKLQLPYKVLSCGYNRIVYNMGNRVLKVAISIKGITDNRMEVKLYRKSPKRLRKHLVKVKASGHGWLVMKKVKKQIPRSRKYKKTIIKIMNKFVKRGIMPNDIFVQNRPEPEWRNLGIKKREKVMILDYGNFKWRKRAIRSKRFNRDKKLNPSRYPKSEGKFIRVPPRSGENSSKVKRNERSILWLNPAIRKLNSP
jgi:hypothetical protein